MDAYLDASALVKRFVLEEGTDAVKELVDSADACLTVSITKAEVGSALSRAARQGVIEDEEGRAALAALRAVWPDLVRIPVSEALLETAVELASKHGLRGYDSVQLAAATMWQSANQNAVRFATFDQKLARPAAAVGLEPFPAA